MFEKLINLNELPETLNSKWHLDKDFFLPSMIFGKNDPINNIMNTVSEYLIKNRFQVYILNFESPLEIRNTVLDFTKDCITTNNYQIPSLSFESKTVIRILFKKTDLFSDQFTQDIWKLTDANKHKNVIDIIRDYAGYLSADKNSTKNIEANEFLKSINDFKINNSKYDLDKRIVERNELRSKLELILDDTIEDTVDRSTDYINSNTQLSLSSKLTPEKNERVTKVFCSLRSNLLCYFDTLFKKITKGENRFNLHELSFDEQQIFLYYFLAILKKLKKDTLLNTYIFIRCNKIHEFYFDENYNLGALRERGIGISLVLDRYRSIDYFNEINMTIATDDNELFRNKIKSELYPYSFKDKDDLFIHIKNNNDITKSYKRK